MKAAGFSRWISQGACRDEDPEIFFPITAQGPAAAQASAAKAVCRRCAVNAACQSFQPGRHLGRHHPGRAPRHAALPGRPRRPR
jgi:hypothetical protein